MTDEHLMKMVGEDDLNKAAVLFDRYHVYLYNFYRKKGHPLAVCEDMSQNVFERMLRYRASYNPTQSFRTWFFRIARNVEADHLGKSKIKVEDHFELQTLGLTTGNVLDEIEQKEQVTNLQQAMDRLSKEEQELLHFSKFQKLKYKEIASIMQLSESAVKVKIHRAIKKLKGHYQKIALQ